MSAQQKEILQELAPATIYHMTHIENLPSILKHGLFAHNNPYQQQDISNQDVNNRRSGEEPIHNKSIHSYVPFYFNPRNAMLYATQKNYGRNIIILGFDSTILLKKNSIFTTANAAANGTGFSGDIEDLQVIDWDTVFQKTWYNQPPRVKQTMMAEVLIHKHLDMGKLQSINCASKFILPQVKKIATKTLKKHQHKAISIIQDRTLFFGNLL